MSNVTQLARKGDTPPFTILNLHPPACCVVWHDNMQMHIWRLQALSSVPLDRDRKCNSGHLSLLPSLFHGLSDYIENLGWCNGKIDKGTDLNTQTILSSLSASPEDTSLLALRSIQIWLFSFNSFYILNYSFYITVYFMWTYHTIIQITSMK